MTLSHIFGLQKDFRNGLNIFFNYLPIFSGLSVVGGIKPGQQTKYPEQHETCSCQLTLAILPPHSQELVYHTTSISSGITFRCASRCYTKNY